MTANFDIKVYTIAHENLFHPCKIGRAPYGVRLISYNAGQAPYNVRPGIVGCYHIHIICDRARENSNKSSGAMSIIKFAGDVQIA